MDLLSNPPPDADLYVEDEAQLALHPTLTRCWTKKGKGRQRRIPAPGTNRKRHVFAATDWRNGGIVRYTSDHRDSATFCALANACVVRSAKRGRRAMLLVDNAGIHKPERAKRVRDLISQHGNGLDLIYLPSYSPDLQPQEWLWRAWRREVTHNHHRETLEGLEEDSNAFFRQLDMDPLAALRAIGSPFLHHLAGLKAA